MIERCSRRPGRWRLASRPGRDLRKAQDLLSWDLDAFEERAEGYSGPLKVQLACPWTLAASVELPNGHRVLTDPGGQAPLTELEARLRGEPLHWH